MKKIYFISDLHLSFKSNEFEKEREERIFRFLDYIEDKAEKLYLVGDIFDFWFEWYHVIPRYHFNFLYKLRQLIDKGIEIIYITGNHDFYLGTYFEEQIGIKCIDECTEFEYSGKKIFVGHGDGYSENDKGYKVLKKILRSRACNFLFKTFIPPDLGIEIAKFTSGTSRKHSVSRKAFCSDYYDFAKKKFSEGFDIVLLGHLHTPILIEENESTTYVNTGDWLQYFTYAELDKNSITLNKFE